MQHRSVRRRTLGWSLVGPVFACAGLFGAATSAVPPCVRAGAVAYLVNVQVRPGYNVANAGQGVSYGHVICDKVSAGRSDAAVMGGVKTDFFTSDEYQGSYLISQAGNELCPALIRQLRNSAAHYRPLPGG